MRSLILFVTLLCASSAAAALPSLTALPVSSNALSRVPTEVYGPPNAPVALRIGNGGAGPTGILRALAEDYLEVRGLDVGIAWVQNISRLNLEALEDHTIDVALTYEPEHADRALREGWASRAVPVFNDHFLIVGPINNPAGILPGDSPRRAMDRIARYGEMSPARALFLSRDDHSGTNHREQLLWVADGVMPWAEACPWYLRHPVFPAEALQRADREQLYTLTDHGTWLSQRPLLRNSRVYVQGGAELLNPCAALLSNQPSPLARDFVDYLASPRAQHLIAEFGTTRFAGSALFTPAAQADFHPNC